MNKLKKITELTERLSRTVHVKNANGRRVRTQEFYIGKRRVQTINSGPRFGHFFIDMIALNIIYYIIEYLFNMVLSFVAPYIAINLTIVLVTSILSLLSFPLFYFFFELKLQRTPGKFLTKSLVIDEYGNKPDARTLILRSIIRLIPFEMFSCLSDQSYGWHDRWSKTWVVTEEELETLKKLQAEQSIIEDPPTRTTHSVDY